MAIVVLAILCLFASGLYLLGTLRGDEAVVMRLQPSVPVIDPKFPERLALLLGVPLTRGDQYEVLIDGDQAFPRMIGAIESAERRISLQTDSFASGEVAVEFGRALAAAAAREVETRLIVDAGSDDELADDQIARVERAGASVRRTRHASSSGAPGRASRRWVLIVDGSVAFTGSVGIADQYRGHAHDRDHWRGTQIRVAGPAARQLEGAFLDAWLDVGGGDWPDVGPEPSWSDGWTRSVVLRSRAPGQHVVSRLYLLSIAGAERRISIATSVFSIDATASAAFEDALARGVQVRLLTGASPDPDAVDSAAAGRGLRDGRQLESLLEKGLEIFEYQPTRLEAGILVVDGTWSVLGSAGLDLEAMAATDALIVGIHDQDVGARLENQFERDLLQSTRLTLDTWRSRPSGTSLLDSLRRSSVRLLEWLRRQAAALTRFSSET